MSILKIAAHTQDLRSHSKTLREKRWPQRALTVTCSRSSVCGWSLAGEVVKITESRSSSGKHPAIFNATSLFSLKMRNLGRQGTRVSLRAHQGGASLSPFLPSRPPPLLPAKTKSKYCLGRTARRDLCHAAFSRLEVTVTSLHPPHLCRIAVFSIKPTFSLLKPCGSLHLWTHSWGSSSPAVSHCRQQD